MKQSTFLQKATIFGSVILISGCAFVLPTKAQDSASNALPEVYPTRLATGTQSKRIENLKLRASTETTRRITRLKELQEKLKLLKKTPQNRKSEIDENARQEIQKLTELKNKTASTQNLTLIKSYTQTLSNSHKSFSFISQQLHSLVLAENIITTIDGVLQDTLPTLPLNNSKDKTLTELTTLLVTAKAQAIQAQHILLNLSVSQIATNTMQLQTSIDLIKDSHKTFKQALSLIREHYVKQSA